MSRGERTQTIRRFRVVVKYSGNSLAAFLDSGFSALATFLTGLFAIQNLSSENLALYSLFLTGVTLTALLPQQLVYVPIRLEVNLAEDVRAPHLRRDGLRSFRTSIIAAVATFACGLPLVASTTASDYFMFGLSAAALAILSPLQSHMRSSLHLVGRHASAALASATQFVLTVGLLGTFTLFNAGGLGIVPLVPLGVLAVTNLLSLLIGHLLLRDVEAYGLPLQTKFRTRVAYLGSDVVMQSTWYLFSVIVVVVLGHSALAALESARVISSPIFVLASGLSAFLTPAAIRSVRRDPRRAFGRAWRMASATAAAGGLYTAFVAVMGPAISIAMGRSVNPSLATARSAAFSIEGASNAVSAVLYARGRAVPWVVATFLAALAGIIVLPFSLILLGPVGLPCAQAIVTGSRLAGGLVLLVKAGRQGTRRVS